jgi:hypothetical protein
MMDVEMFREKYLAAAARPTGHKEVKTLTPWSSERTSVAEKAYTAWLQQQTHRSAQQTRHVTKVDAEAVLSDLESGQQPLPPIKSASADSRDSAKCDELDVKCDSSELSHTEEVYVFSAEKGYAKPYVQPTAPDRVDIPEEAKKRRRYGLYRLGDAFYDADGEFLYRVPGAGAD